MARGRSRHRARGSHPAAGKRARTKSATLAQAQIARSTCGNRGASIVGRTISTATAAASVSVPTREPEMVRMSGLMCQDYNPSC